LYKVGDEYSEERIKEIFGTVEERPEFNYLFLDEVQDLPPAVIYLISLVFGNGVYYSGDTAQAIHKGVSFKFSDITNMYRESFPI
jgi:superfamily I DNA/RNA helicase